MKLMDRLPAVISCCFCCFLRAGTVVISIVSFAFGLLFAPNVNHVKGIWDVSGFLKDVPGAMETGVQVVLGGVSIILCCISILLLVGSLCNMPRLIEIYQWGAVIYSSTISVLFLILAVVCFFVHQNGVLAGCALIGLVFINLLCTLYFIIVANSLRISLEFLSSTDL